MVRALNNRYQVDEPLGSGPHGVVYAGTDTEGRRLAFKTLRHDLRQDPDVMARYLQIQGAVEALDDPNLVGVHDLVAADDAATIVMDLVSGRSLRELIASSGPLLPAEVARFGSGIAGGLARLLRAGLVHGNLNPENVLIDESGPQKEPRLTDFLLSRLLTKPSAGQDTPLLNDARYRAPELADGGPPTPASDLYALGAILYEMCCGVPPFVGRTDYSVVRQHVEYEPGRPEGIPDELWHIIWLLLTKNPADRQQGAHEVAVVMADMVVELMPAPLASQLTTPPEGRRLAETARPAETPHSRLRPDPSPVSFDNPTSAIPTVGGPVAKGKGRRRLVTVGVLAVLVVAGLITWIAVRPSGGSQPTAAPRPGDNIGVVSDGPSVPSIAPTTESSVPPLTVAPNLIGESLDKAQDSLPTSLSVQTVDTVDSKDPDGTVIGQRPAAGQPLNGPMVLTIARQPVVTYLDSLTEASGQWGNDNTGTTTQLAGKSYIHSMVADVQDCSDTQSIEYDIAKGYRNFVTTAGIDDQSSSSSLKVNLQIFGDGRLLRSVDIAYGKPDLLTVDVSGVLRLKIQFQPVAPDPEGFCDTDATFALGTAQLQGLPGEVPIPSSESEDASTEPTN